MHGCMNLVNVHAKLAWHGWMHGALHVLTTCMGHLTSVVSPACMLHCVVYVPKYMFVHVPLLSDTRRMTTTIARRGYRERSTSHGA